MKALIPGSFDPPTNGHVDVIDRSLRIFDEVVVLVSDNYRKECLLKTEMRVELLKDILRNKERVTVDSYDGLIAEYAKNNNIPVIIRGVRNERDFSYEFEMALNNRVLNNELEVLFMPSSQKNLIISSSQVREVLRYGGDISSFVPYEVLEALTELGVLD